MAYEPVFVLMMNRYGDDGGEHAYCLGAFSTYSSARDHGMEAYEYRGHKYEPQILRCIVDGIVTDKYFPIRGLEPTKPTEDKA